MEDSKNTGEEKVVAEPNEAEHTPTQEVEAQTNSQEHRAPEEDKNWKEVRSVIKDQQEKIKELESKLYGDEEVQETAETPLLDDNDLITVGETNKRFQSYEQQLAQIKLDMKFPDFNQVVTKETIERLKKEQPELAISLEANSDSYTQAAAAYKLVKSLGYVQSDAAAKEAKAVEENQNIPRSSASAARSVPLSQANSFARGLTPDMRNKFYQEMKQAQKQV